jgi:hypothetical protein
MILSALLALTAADPTLEQAQTCRAHMELFIEEVSRESGHAAGPTWFIRDWWTLKAIEAGSPEDDGAIIEGLKRDLSALRAEHSDEFDAGRRSCVDTAIEAGAVPGMGPE